MGPLTSTPSGIPANDVLSHNDTMEVDAVSEGQMLAVSVLLVSLSIFGTFGNGLVLYVFTRKNDNVTSTIFILSLAWCDFFTCLIIMPFTVANIQLENHLVYDVICKFYHFLITSNVPLSAFIMVAVAVDRYFSICHPFLHAVTPRRARISIICLCVFAFSLGTITACMHGVYEIVEAGNCVNHTTDLNRTGHGLIALSQGNDKSNPVVYAMHNAIGDHGNDNNNNNHSNTFVDTFTSPKPTTICSGERKVLYREGGLCEVNLVIFSEYFFSYYHPIYISFYIISLLSVFALYFLIYRSVVKRRAWRRKQKSWSHSPMTATAHTNAKNNVTVITTVRRNDEANAVEGENMELNAKTSKASPADGVDDNNDECGGGCGGGVDGSGANKHNDDSGISGCKTATVTDTTPALAPATTGTTHSSSSQNGKTNPAMEQSSAEKKSSRERRDFNFLANIRTAVMLFVVTIVFIIFFLPAWLMATFLIDYHAFVFYMYFCYNVANPVIYAFMNQSFRKELTRVFQRECRFSKCCKPKPSKYRREHEMSRTGNTIYSVCESPDEMTRHVCLDAADSLGDSVES